MLILLIGNKRLSMPLSRKTLGDYMKAGRHQNIGFNSKIISGKES